MLELTIVPLGTSLYGVNSGAPGVTIVRAGIFDNLELLNEHTPKAEIYINGRVSWVRSVEGADQCVGMPPLPQAQ
ncbi:hypothetical protein IMZ48_32370 [Candidatus Bathyarchaeota archaeon]|nr:hypothetical protein [Candidatus Bathyarchaeota archaeon]